MFDIVAIGESLIDFSPAGFGKMGNPTFEMNPGGAPINCLAAANALGAKTAFVGMVGQDMFGESIIHALNEVGISTMGVQQTSLAKTTMAFVKLDENGERSFLFLRNPGADSLLKNVDKKILDSTQVVHFGSISLTNNPARKATLDAIKYAKRKGKIISYDPNYRPPLWETEAHAIKWMNKGIDYADIVKLSIEELVLLTGCDKTDYEIEAKKIADTGKCCVLITFGNKGSYYVTQKTSGFCPGIAVDVIDTTGCGDAFTGAFLYLLCRQSQMDLHDIVSFSNVVGALCARNIGGMPAMPSNEAVNELLEEIKGVD